MNLFRWNKPSIGLLWLTREGGESGVDGDGGGGYVGVREIEIGFDTGANRVPEIRSEACGSDEVEG